MNFALAVFVAMFAGGVVLLRCFAARGDLWLDEIASVTAATNAASYANIFTTLVSDNNHHLYSVWLRALGPSEHGLCYRSLSVVAGFALLWLL